MRAEFRSGIFNLDDDFLTAAAVLEDVWGQGAGLLWGRGFRDRVAAGADGLVDEAHDDWLYLGKRVRANGFGKKNWMWS